MDVSNETAVLNVLATMTAESMEVTSGKIAPALGLAMAISDVPDEWA